MTTLRSFLVKNGIQAKVIEKLEGPLADVYWMDLDTSIRKVRALIEDIRYKFGYTDVLIEPDAERRAVRFELYKAGVGYLPHPPRSVYSATTELDFKIPIAEGLYGPIIHDFKRDPHMLIAGTTGAGKTKLLLNILNSILVRPSRVFMIDFKGVDFTDYYAITRAPITRQVYKDRANYRETSIGILNYFVEEMERRKAWMAHMGVSNYDSCDAIKSNQHWFLIVDELNDVMQGDKDVAKQFEDGLRKLAEQSRATAMHIILATQRPTVDAVPGHIKANIMSRVALKTATAAESRIILDADGAEMLDAGSLFYTNGSSLQYGKAYKYEIDKATRSVLEFWNSEAEIKEAAKAAAREQLAIQSTEPQVPEQFVRRHADNLLQYIAYMSIRDEAILDPIDLWYNISPMERAQIVVTALQK